MFFIFRHLTIFREIKMPLSLSIRYIFFKKNWVVASERKLISSAICRGTTYFVRNLELGSQFFAMDIDGAQYDTGTHKDFGVARENALAAVQCRGENATKKKRRRIDSETKDQAAEFCTRLVDSDNTAVILFCASLEMPCCSANLTFSGERCPCFHSNFSTFNR